MNTKLLRKIKKHILEEPRRFVMHSVILTKEMEGDSYIDDARKPTKFATCGTAACIAGWAIQLSGKQYEKGDGWHFGTKVLGLTSDQALQLFYQFGWPKQFDMAFRRSRSRKKRAEIAADRIDHFIKTKGKE